MAGGCAGVLFSGAWQHESASAFLQHPHRWPAACAPQFAAPGAGTAARLIAMAMKTLMKFEMAARISGTLVNRAGGMFKGIVWTDGQCPTLPV